MLLMNPLRSLSSVKFGRTLLVLGGGFAAGSSFAGAHPTVANQTEPVVYTDMAAIPLTPFGPMQARAVLADTSGIAMAVLPAGMKQTPNHHDQEQITLNV